VGLIIDQDIEVLLNARNIKHFEDLGITIPRRKDKWNRICIPKGTKIIVKVEDLTDGSRAYIKVNCDACKTELSTTYENYKQCAKEDGSYYCNLCSKNNNEKWISFEEKCYELFDDNYAKEILNRWDYDINNCKPSEIPYGSGKSYYFKCSRGLHESQLIRIASITSGKTLGCMVCSKCNSFAQWGIDNLGEYFLDKYWHKDNIIDPWKISYGTPNVNILIKCQKENNKHPDYKITPNLFTRDRGCPGCGIESKSGENAYQWKGGITALNHCLRKIITQWNKDSIANCNYKCILTGGKFHVVHHLKGFELLIKETLSELELPVHSTLSEYNVEELQLIKDKCLELHYKYGLGVCLSESLHKLFHAKFGRGNNTPEQFYEFQENYKNGVYDNTILSNKLVV